MPKWRSRSHALAIVAISFPVSQPSGTVSTRRSKCLDPGRQVTFLQRYSSRIWLRIADELLGRKIKSSSADLVQFLIWMSASSLKARVRGAGRRGAGAGGGGAAGAAGAGD